MRVGIGYDSHRLVAGRPLVLGGVHVPYEKGEQGHSDGDALITAMKGMAFESPRGPISIDPDTRDIVQPIYIRKVEKINGELWNTEFAKFDDVKDPLKVKK